MQMAATAIGNNGWFAPQLLLAQGTGASSSFLTALLPADMIRHHSATPGQSAKASFDAPEFFKCGLAVFKVQVYRGATPAGDGYQGGYCTGEAHMQIATHAGKMGTPSQDIIMRRAKGMKNAFSGNATYPTVLKIHTAAPIVVD